MTDTTSCIFHTRVDMNLWFFSYYKFKQAFFIFHAEHYKLYISYQRWYESLLYPLWIIMRAHFCGLCVNNNTYRLKNLAPNFEGRGKTRGFMNFGQPWVWFSQLSLLHLRYIDRIAMIRSHIHKDELLMITCWLLKTSLGYLSVKIVNPILSQGWQTHPKKAPKKPRVFQIKKNRR